MEEKQADILSAERKAKFAEEYAKNEEELAQLRNTVEIMRKRRAMDLFISH